MICMHTYPLALHLRADKYRTGQSLVVTDIQHLHLPPRRRARFAAPGKDPQ